jgi:Domain of unknown function (DUF4123)
MPDTRVNAILDRLWPPGSPRWMKVCAILDGARDPRIFRAVDATTLDKSCLYAGRLPFVVQEVAPYLIVLERDDKFTRYLLQEGWGQSWGIYLRSETPLPTLRRHFRTLLKVKAEDGRRLIFRWYDPRVLRAYLPTCLPDELRAVFGPVDNFYMESRSSSALLEYHLESGHLKQSTFDISHSVPNSTTVLL